MGDVGGSMIVRFEGKSRVKGNTKKFNRCRSRDNLTVIRDVNCRYVPWRCWKLTSFYFGAENTHHQFFLLVDCLSIEPQISAKPPEGCLSYFFDKQLIQDIGVHIVLLHNNVETQESTKCKICKKKVNLKDMRVHVGAHVIKRDIRENLHNICGFCGKHGCHISLEETSHKGSSFHQKVNVSTSFHIRNWGMSLLEKIHALIRFPNAQRVT